MVVESKGDMMTMTMTDKPRPRVLKHGPGLMIASIPSRTGKRVYTTTIVDGVPSCECLGMHFRGDCEHAQSLRMLYELECVAGEVAA